MDNSNLLTLCRCYVRVPCNFDAFDEIQRHEGCFAPGKKCEQFPMKPLYDICSSSSSYSSFFASHHQGMVTQRLQKAIDKGWVAKELVGEAKRVQAALETRQMEDMEAIFGRAEGK